MEDNNIGTDLEAFLNAANLAQLLPVFKAEEIDLQDLLSLPKDELEKLVRDALELQKLLAAIDAFCKSSQNVLDTSLSVMTLDSFLSKHGLGEYSQNFADEGVDLETLHDLSEADLRKFVLKVGHWNKLCRVRRGLSEQTKSNSAGPSNGGTAASAVPEMSLTDFMNTSSLDSSLYVPLLEGEGVGMEELLDLPDDLLKMAVPKMGPWNKLCKARRSFLEKTRSEQGACSNFNIVEKADMLEEFLQQLGLQNYLHTFRAEEMDYEDLMKISEDHLRKLVPKMGPANKILEAQKRFKPQKRSKARVQNSFSEDEEEDEKENVPENADGAEERKTLNILLLGETGVGKSTFINAFANYLTFETMEEAMRGKILALIASSFAVTDEQFVHHKVSIGEDVNENNSSGQSATQACKSYLFPFEHLSIRLIDTPGIGDTRGIEQDKINLDNILAFIGQHDDLHGICILLKPNNARLSVSFTFCIKELLSHLQKDAARNILFVFTNSRSTFYKPGDTAPTLKAILDEIEKSPPYVRIPFEKETVYCYDNESFRFLMTLHEGIQFSGDHCKIYSESWKVSVKECKRMIGRIAVLVPHKVQDTVSINEARRLIIELSKPIADIAQNINVNLQVIADKRRELLLMDSDIKGLAKKLKVPVIDLEQRPFDKPRTVCTASSCIEIRTVGSITKTNFKQKCHDPCYLRGVQAELIDNPALLQCQAMAGTSSCQVCKCSYKLHMHIYYDNVEVEKHIEDSTIQDLIDQKADGKALIAQSIITLQERSQDLEQEKDLLTKATAKFAVFLKSNAIAPYNDSFQDYLEHLVSNERTKSVMAGASNQVVIEGLEKMLGAYQAEKQILDDAMAVAAGMVGSEAAILTPASIQALEKELYAMKINGARLKQFRQGYQAARHKEHTSYSETVHQPAASQGKPGQKSKAHWVNRMWNGVKSFAGY